MHPYLVLKTLHVAAVVLAFVGVAGLAAHAASGGTKADNRAYGLLAALHGTGLLVAAIGGFGMLYLVMRLPSMPSPAWATAKLVLWVLLAVAAVVPYRWSGQARRLLALGLPLLALIGAAVAILKPF
jgi:uncharacterized membrane protein SirB2